MELDAAVYMEEEDEAGAAGGPVGAVMGGSGATKETSPEEARRAAAWDAGRTVAPADLYLYFNISALTAASSASKAWTCCCKAEIAPMHP